jgi:hypothetical protein
MEGEWMPRTPEELEAEVLGLPRESRARLAARLLSSLDGPEEAEIDRVWAEEAERRDLELTSRAVSGKGVST